MSCSVYKKSVSPPHTDVSSLFVSDLKQTLSCVEDVVIQVWWKNLFSSFV